MSQPEPSTPFIPSQAFGHALSLMSREAGNLERNWDLMEWLVQSQGLGDIAQPLQMCPAATGAMAKKTQGLLAAVARQRTSDQTRSRRTAMLKRLIEAGANPWAADLDDGVAVLKALVSSPVIDSVINHEAFPGWGALSADHHFKPLIKSLDESGIKAFLALGLPANLQIRSQSAYGTPSSVEYPVLQGLPGVHP